MELVCIAQEGSADEDEENESDDDQLEAMEDGDDKVRQGTLAELLWPKWSKVLMHIHTLNMRVTTRLHLNFVQGTTLITTVGTTVLEIVKMFYYFMFVILCLCHVSFFV